MSTHISKMLHEIKTETGWSEPKIAAELGISQPTVNRIINGQQDCKGTTFQLIEALHKKTCIDAIKKINKRVKPRQLRT